MINQKFLSANEAAARGFYEAGGVLAAGYPGTPTADTIQYIKDNYSKEIYAEYSQNEIVAMQVGEGASISGGRVMVNMKSLGLNVGLDAIMTFNQAHINGGFLLFVADDPGLQNSQNEQDSRALGKFASMGILCPTDSQETKDFAKVGPALSERFDLPMMLRITTPQCFSYGVVDIQHRQNVPLKPYVKSQENYCMFPPFSSAAQVKMKNSLAKLTEYAYDTPLNVLEEYPRSDTLIITVGFTYLLVKELKPKASILKLGLVYPLSPKYILELGKRYSKIIVCEELLPFVEDEIKIIGVRCEGKKYFPEIGQLTVEDVARGLIDAGVITTTCINNRCDVVESIPCMDINKLPIKTVDRNPIFFSGCPHRPIFNILKDIDATIVGDIGCYTIGMYFPWKVNAISLNMGSAPGVVKGIAEINRKKKDKTPIVGLIGDGTFYHSALMGIYDILQKEPNDSNITIIILNNGTIALTGWEPNPTTGNYTDCRSCGDYRCETCGKNCEQICGDTFLDAACLVRSYGFKDVTTIDQFNESEAKQIIKSAISRTGVKIIVATRPCVPAFCIESNHFVVDETKCIACGNCVKLACEPIRFKEYPGQLVEKAYIEPILCNGCSVCAQLCPVNAISRCKGNI